jgi:hypothetical protein
MKAAAYTRYGPPDVVHACTILRSFSGTPSFTAAGWQGSFYPRGMRPSDYLAF